MKSMMLMTMLQLVDHLSITKNNRKNTRKITTTWKQPGNDGDAGRPVAPTTSANLKCRSRYSAPIS